MKKNKPNPIIIPTIPRSGSSMTAGIFAHHGVWVGPCKPANERNKKGFFESRPFLSRSIQYLSSATFPKLEGPDRKWVEEVESILDQNGYEGGPWLFKHSARHFPLWADFEPFFVCPVRKMESVKKSNEELNRKGRVKRNLEKDIEAFEYMKKHVPHVKVFTDEVIEGDYSSLENAFEYCGLKFDPSIADEFIDPSLWHHK